MSPTKTQRWLDLLALLVGRRIPLSIDEIMEQVPAYRDRWTEGDETARASVRRMFERDKDELRRLGIPMETRRFRVEGLSEAEGYLILRRDFYLPYLRLLAAEEEEEGARVPGSAPAPTGTGPPGTGGASGALPHSVGQVTLSEDDARTAVLALRQVLTLPSFPFGREARSALGKLTFDLDPALGGGVGAPGTEEDDPPLPPVRILDRPGGADPEGVLGTLLDALYDRRRIRFRYHSIGRDVVEDREVEPWGLLFQWGSWYLVARDPEKDGDEALGEGGGGGGGDPAPRGAPEGDRPDRDARAGEDPPASPAVRLFRVDRMAKAHLARPGARGPDFQVPRTFDVREFGGRKAWELEEEEGPDMEVVVRFLPPAGLLAIRNRWGEPAQSGKEGSVLRRFQVSRLDPFLRWILSMAGEARIVSPPAAKAGLARMAGRVRELYGEGS
jgi:predicted DNA-binding transcriptional regulator YafY